MTIGPDELNRIMERARRQHLAKQRSLPGGSLLDEEDEPAAEQNDDPFENDLGADAPASEQPRSNGHHQQQSSASDEQSGKEATKIFWHGGVDYRESRPQLVQDVIPEVGHGLISGQWGTFKTFAALDLAHACMSGETRRQAFYRAVTAAQDASLIAIREVNGVQLVWLTKPEA